MSTLCNFCMITPLRKFLCTGAAPPVWHSPEFSHRNTQSEIFSTSAHHFMCGGSSCTVTLPMFLIPAACLQYGTSNDLVLLVLILRYLVIFTSAWRQPSSCFGCSKELRVNLNPYLGNAVWWNTTPVYVQKIPL